MTHPPMDIVVLGLSITSSWGNGHATTYRALCRQLTTPLPYSPPTMNAAFFTDGITMTQAA